MKDRGSRIEDRGSRIEDRGSRIEDGRSILDSRSSILDPQAAIRVKDLWKRYGAVEAVRGVSLEVNKGEIFGLIGPDGAGKTTTFQILAGVMEADSGAAEVFGRPAREMRAQTGYLTQTFSLYPDLSVMENIRYIGDLRGVPPNEIIERGRRYLRMFDMDRFEGRLAGRLSGGMKQKLALACALVPQPSVLLLDEPTTGVDPVSRREFWDTLAHLAAEGLTIMVATPYLDEAERCRRVALMHLGEIRQLGAPAELRAGLRARRLELRASNLGEAERALSEIAGPGEEIVDVQRFGDRLDLRARVAIGADNLVKQFGAFTAVKGVSLQVRQGEIYGLLGANGAGKTTTIKMLCGLLEPTSGEIHLAGERSLRSGAVRQQIGYMSQKFSLYNDLSIEENLDFFAGVYGVPDEEREEKKRWVLSFSGLEGKEGQITGSLPGGWKQRVAFGAAIMHEPRILFLDEPTSGVDPLARRAFWKMINRLADAGAAILVTTHYLEESEQCNRLGMMVAGELVAEGSPSDLKSQQTGHLLEFIVDQQQRAADLLKSEMERWRVSLFGDRLHVITDEDPESGMRATAEELEANGIHVRQARVEGKVASED